MTKRKHPEPLTEVADSEEDIGGKDSRLEGQSLGGANALELSPAATVAREGAASCEVAEIPTVVGVAGQVDEGSETVYTI